MRARDLGIRIGLGTPGPKNAITDVDGVTVGHTTLIGGDGPLVVGQGPVRTGVTVVCPRGAASLREPVFAGCHRLNGNGELTGIRFSMPLADKIDLALRYRGSVLENDDTASTGHDSCDIGSTLGLNPEAVRAAMWRMRERQMPARRIFARTRQNVRRRGRITLRRSVMERL